ncbi:glycoside hydrolase 43 family protein [Bacillus glycinifermentans]|uniref:glycoside hydrolase family 43 protein n=1 Tax=Bacillus glycinifermentans TaxID=1664069 RepID=UPI002DB98877|nr:glycoside hydrolase 43 family protein [Bacillus glycinifermentans]MEC3609531.1 glycoside hydrolase 43 family protein [Bacillus glycinifermentans]
MAKHLTGSLQQRTVWNPNIGNGRFRNPVLFMDYSDPDIVRKGSDFFMAASSFSCFPGIPILHSRDLVNWNIIGHVFDQLPFEDYEEPAHGKGAWAPSIRYHNGAFWVYFATPDEGIFMSKTKDPFRGWEPLVHVKKTKGWIDPCPFWDDDGQAYLIHAYANSRIGIKSKLNLCRMKNDGTALIDDGKIVFDGTLNHPTIEGPKLYKRGGYYYLFAPAGGVKEGWRVLEPHCQTSDDFSSKSLALQWQWQANPKRKWYSLHARPGHLRMYSRRVPDRWKLGSMPNVIMQKFPGPSFTATAKLSLYALSETIRAGLAVMGKEYAYLAFSKSEKIGAIIAFYKGSIEEGSEDIKTEEHAVSDGPVYLRVTADEKAVCRFSYSFDERHFTAIGEAFQAVPGLWIGAKVGMFCADAGTAGPEGYGDIDWFIVEQNGACRDEG